MTKAERHEMLSRNLAKARKVRARNIKMRKHEATSHNELTVEQATRALVDAIVRAERVRILSFLGSEG